MSRKVLACFMVLFLALLACGKADEASTAKCASAADGDKCQACCKSQGRNGYRYSSSGGCACL